MKRNWYFWVLTDASYTMQKNTGIFESFLCAKIPKSIRDALIDSSLGQERYVSVNIGLNVGINEEKILKLPGNNSKLAAEKIAAKLSTQNYQLKIIM